MPVVNGGGGPTPTPTPTPSPSPPPLTGTGGLFPRINKLGRLLGDINANRGTTIPSDVSNIQAQYQSSNQDIISNLYQYLSNYQNSAGNFNPNIRTMATNTLLEMIDPIDGQLQTAINNLISQMNAASQTVQQNTVSGVITYTPGNVGNPNVVVSMRDVLYPHTELCLAEMITATCTNSVQFSPGLAGVEPFLLRGQPLVTDPLSWLFPNSSGSGANLTVNAANPLSQSGQGGPGNWTVGGSFESWGPTANMPQSWEIETGTPGATILQATATFYDGASSLQISSSGSESTAIREQFSLAAVTGTMRATLYPNVQLAVNCFLKLSSVPAAGVLRIAMTDGTNVINANDGTPNQLLVSLPTIGTNWYAAGWAFRTPSILPAAVYLELKLATPLSAGVSLFVDRVAVNQMTRMYSGGPYISIFSGNKNMAKGDTFTVNIANDYLGDFQNLFNRLFGMAAKGLQLPSSGTSTWYNQNWRYQLPIPVTNPSTTSNLSYYQMPIMVSGANYTTLVAHAQSNLADLFVTDSDGITPLPFTLEQIDAANSTIYLLVKVSIAANSSKTIYIYYGNPAATSASSYPTTIGPTSALAAPTDAIVQATAPGATQVSGFVRLRHQDQANGGGSVLNGTLYAIALGMGTANFPPTNAKLFYVTSSNNGVTWSAPTVIATPVSGSSFIARSLVELKDGTLVFSYTYGVAATIGTNGPNYVAKLVGGPAGTWTNLSTSPTSNLDAAVGATTDSAPFGPMCVDGITGNLMMSYYWTAVDGITLKVQVLKCPFGVDYTNAANWSVAGTINSSTTFYLSETAICQPTPGNYVAISRNDTQSGQPTYNGDLYVSFGSASGTTWTTPVRMNLPGTVGGQAIAAGPWVQVLPSGNLLALWSQRYGTVNYGVACALSTDGGHTWLDRPIAMPATYPVAGQSPIYYAYPETDLLPDGSVAMLWYHGVSDNSWNEAFLRLTEDWVANQGNLYEPCQSLSGFTSVGAGATVDATHTLNGAANAIKLDNSATFPAHATRAWTSDASIATPRSRTIAWVYPTAVAAHWIVFTTQDTTGVNLHDVEIDNTLNHIRWYNGTTDIDTGVVAALNRWHRLGQRMDSQGTGEINLDGSVATSSAGHFGTGGGVARVQYQAGSGTASEAATCWLGTIYTAQYTPASPTFSVGTEQVNTSTSIPYN